MIVDPAYRGMSIGKRLVRGAEAPLPCRNANAGLIPIALKLPVLDPALGTYGHVAGTSALNSFMAGGDTGSLSSLGKVLAGVQDTSAAAFGGVLARGGLDSRSSITGLAEFDQSRQRHKVGPACRTLGASVVSEDNQLLGSSEDFRATVARADGRVERWLRRGRGGGACDRLLSHLDSSSHQPVERTRSSRRLSSLSDGSQRARSASASPAIHHAVARFGSAPSSTSTTRSPRRVDIQ